MPSETEAGQKWRHKKRGSVYTIIGRASLECSSLPEFEAVIDDTFMVVYRSETTGALFVRPEPEFCDGRFELIGEAE